MDLLPSLSKRKSLFVTIPHNFLDLFIIGIPPMLFFFIDSLASDTFESNVRVTGSNIMPDSALLTNLTLLACFSIDMFLWRTPIPPSLASAIAILLSVTVSIAAEITGIFNGIFLEKLVLISTSLGKTSEYFGTRSTSSNVRPSWIL